MTTILRPGQRILNIPGYGVQTSRRAVSVAAAAGWWLAGGAPTPIAVYQPKGAADLATSYVNLITPGTYNAAPGSAPTFNAATGWTFNGSSQYLTTGIAVTTNNFSAIVRWSGFDTGVAGFRSLFGYYDGGSDTFGVDAKRGNDGLIGWYNAAVLSLVTATPVAAGVAALAGDTGYLNGLSVGTMSQGANNQNNVYIGATFYNSGAANYIAADLLALAIWNTSTGHVTWMPAVMAAVALI